MRAKPSVLLSTTERWYPTVRMAMALAEAGCAVDVLCPPGHPVSTTSRVRCTYDYNGLMPMRSFIRAITASHPELVIPGDDLAARQLHELYGLERQKTGTSSDICKLIERSLGAASGFEIVNARSAFMQLALEEGIRVPDTAVIRNTSDLRKWITRVDFPCVLKANGTSGGDGVKVTNSIREAEQAFRKLQAPPLLARAVKRALVDGDLTLLWPSLSRSQCIVNGQAFINGNEATSTLACWQGTVLASLHFEVLEKMGSTGHATVVRLIEHPEISSAAEKISRRLKLSGLHGLDFMLEARTGDAYLIEINPRTTQVGHLALGAGRDLPAALYAAITDKKIEAAPRVTERDTIALFPQEWKRDPRSAYLSSSYHDVPWAEPVLVGNCVSNIQKQRSQNPRKAAQESPRAQVVAPANKGQGAAWIAEQE